MEPEIIVKLNEPDSERQISCIFSHIQNLFFLKVMEIEEDYLQRGRGQERVVGVNKITIC
jgi:hypothetical protein